MIYRTFQDMKLSALGMGCMRLPCIDGNDANIDAAATAEMVDYAMANGINYYDTAWGYHDGHSQEVLGDCLARHPRESFYVAQKFPGYDPSCWGKVEEIFQAQLEKTKVDYFDFYLFHNVCEMNIDAYLDDEKYGIYTYLKKQKDAGIIRHLGFSAHGTYATMKRFLEAYGDDMEFCQIQLNYLDFRFQDAKAKLELLAEYSIPVWVMEPLRGGRLSNLSDAECAVLKEAGDMTPTEWAFRWLQSQEQVVVTLSGMSNFEQMKQNIATYAEEKPLNEAQTEAISKLVDMMINSKALPCTSCHYCVSHCPQHLDIPKLISLYNEDVLTGGGFIAPMGLMSAPAETRPGSCIGCQSCETVCPQQLPISETMTSFHERLVASPWGGIFKGDR